MLSVNCCGNRATLYAKKRLLANVDTAVATLSHAPFVMADPFECYQSLGP